MTLSWKKEGTSRYASRAYRRVDLERDKVVNVIQTADAEDDAHESDQALRNANIDIPDAETYDETEAELVQQHKNGTQVMRMFLDSRL